jgi:hypothetical protein
MPRDKLLIIFSWNSSSYHLGPSGNREMILSSIGESLPSLAGKEVSVMKPDLCSAFLSLLEMYI